MSTSLLTPPVSDRDHSAGPADAPVTLVEFGDLECPYCRLAEPIVAAARRELGSMLRFVYRHFPLAEMHPHARMAAQATEAAGAQGRFWEMRALLFEHQDALGENDLFGYAVALGLDTERFTRELSEQVHARRVSDDFRSGVRSPASGMTTPSEGLVAMGLDAGQALEAIRVSMGAATERKDIEALLEVLPNILHRAKAFS